MLDIREIEYWISRYENEANELDDCVVLAALLSIRDNLNGVNKMKQSQSMELPVPQPQISVYSEAAAPVNETLGRYGDSEFLQAVEGLDPSAAWAVMDSHMSGLRIVNQRAYDSVILKLSGLRNS